MNINSSLGLIQSITNQIATQSIHHTRSLAKNTRKISLVSPENSSIDVFSLPQNYHLEIIVDTQNIVTRVYNITKAMYYKVSNNDTLSQYLNENLQNTQDSPNIYHITLQDIFERILHINLDYFSSLHPMICIKIMKEQNITERFIAFVSQYIPCPYVKEHIENFLLYSLQNSNLIKENILTLPFLSLPTIMTYTTPTLLRMIISDTSTIIPSAPFISSPLSSSLGKKNIQQKQDIPSHIQNIDITIYQKIDIIQTTRSYFSPTPLHSQELRSASAAYFPHILSMLCTLPTHSLEHTRYLILFHSMILYYYLPEHSLFNLKEQIHKLYATHPHILSYTVEHHIPDEYIAFSIALEYNTAIIAMQYLQDSSTSQSSYQIILQYSIFWITLFHNTHIEYSYPAIQRMLAFLPYCMKVSFTIFEQLYTILLYIEKYHKKSTRAILLEDKKIQHTLTHLSKYIDGDIAHLLTQHSTHL